MYKREKKTESDQICDRQTTNNDHMRTNHVMTPLGRQGSSKAMPIMKGVMLKHPPENDKAACGERPPEKQMIEMRGAEAEAGQRKKTHVQFRDFCSTVLSLCATHCSFFRTIPFINHQTLDECK